jgi:hypothetical protein
MAIFSRAFQPDHRFDQDLCELLHPEKIIPHRVRAMVS